MGTAGYDAFISYSLAADGRLAPQLQRGLEHLAKPWSKRRALRVFRDATGLSASPDLWESIVTALDESRWFIVLASPEAAASTWVNREIEHWLASSPGARDRILPVVTDGGWRWDRTTNEFTADSDAVPPALLDAFDAEPRFLDLTWAADDAHLDLRRADFRSSVADLAAPIHGIAKDELESDDIRLHRRAVRVRRAAVAALAGFSVVVAVLAVVALVLRDRAVERAATASSQALASQSGDQLDADHVLGSLLAVESRRVPDLDSIPSAAENALLRAANRLPALVVELATGSDPTAVSIAPDGRSVAVGRRDGTVEIHGVDGSAPSVVTGGSGPVARVSFDQLAGEVRWYDGVASHRFVLATNEHQLTPLAADGRLVAVSGDATTIGVERDGSLSIVDSAGAERVLELDAGYADGVGLSDDGRLVVVRDGDRLSVRSWRDDTVLATADLGAVFAASGRFVDEQRFVDVAFTDDGGTVLVRGETALLGDDFEAPTPWFLTWPLEGEPSVDLRLEGLGELIASSGDGARVVDSRGNVVDVGRYPEEYEPATLGPDSLVAGSFSDDATLFASVDDLGRVRVWMVEQRLGSGHVEDHGFDRELSLEGATSALAPDGRLVAAHSDGSVSVVGPGGEIRSFEVEPGGVGFPVVGFAPDGAVVATTTSRSVVIGADGQELGPPLPAGGVGTGVAAARGEIILAEPEPATDEVLIRRWSIADGAAVGPAARAPYLTSPVPGSVERRVLGPDSYLPGELFDIVVDPTETRVAVELGDRVAVFDLDALTLESEFLGASGPLAFDPTGTRLALVVGARSAIVDVAASLEGRVGDRIPFDADGAVLFEFSPDGTVLGVVEQRRVRVVDATTGLTIIDGLGAGFSPVNLGASIGYTVGGVTLEALEIEIATAPNAGSSVIETATWSIRPEELEATVCRQAGRNLSSDEWDRFITGRTYRTTCAEYPAGE